MKKINFLYFLLLPLLFGWIMMFQKMGTTSTLFYGFAENKETEISHDQPVFIEKILVTPGQTVKEGQLLMEVAQSSIDLKIEQVGYDLEKSQILAQKERQNLRDRVLQLEARKANKKASLEAEIQNLEASISYNQDLLKNLKSIESDNLLKKETPNQFKLQLLKEQLQTEIQPMDVEIAQLQSELAATQTSSQVQQKKLKKERQYFEESKDKLRILAPTDGLIGSILCKEGENISSFSTLLNFYEKNPTRVKGFVHESLILKVNYGDTIDVVSTLHPSEPVVGKVTGLGSRIIEIPERLRKIPDFKTYGREVLIEIPATNPFLQKEKVMLNTLEEVEVNPLALLFSFFQKEEKPSPISSN